MIYHRKYDSNILNTSGCIMKTIIFVFMDVFGFKPFPRLSTCMLIAPARDRIKSGVSFISVRCELDARLAK
jgi:hypothetical protein